jgi:nucleoside-diphosphate-sugar epimerase
LYITKNSDTGGIRLTVYLVTGGAGFIGSHLVQALLKKGGKVKVIDNFATGNKENIKEFLNDIELIEGDLTDYQSVKQATKDVDIIFHQGAIPSVPKSIKDPIRSNHANVTGTLQLLNTAVENKVCRVIYAASSSAYGNTAILPKHEDIPSNPMSPYAITKYTGELYCKIFYEIYGLETMSLRYFNIFGPKQNPDSEYAAVIPKFVKAMLNNQAPTIYGDGNQSRDFTFIDNAIHANLLASQAPSLCGEVINVGTGDSTTLNNLVKYINNLLDRQIQPIYEGGRMGDVNHSLADIRKAYELIGYQPVVPFKEGLLRTVDWFKNRS